MRSGTRLLFPLAALVIGVLWACSFDPLPANVRLSVTGIPADADHLDVLVTDFGSKTYERHPAFGTGELEGRSLELAFQIDNIGAVTVQVTALDHSQTPLAAKSETGTYDGSNTLLLTAALVTTGLDGTFGRPCLTSGVACSGALVCKKYTGTDSGICTLPCPPSCPLSPVGAICEQFPGESANFCLWECGQADAGPGNCPPGLVCGDGIGAKRYCQGTK